MQYECNTNVTRIQIILILEELKWQNNNRLIFSICDLFSENIFESLSLYIHLTFV